MKTSPRISRVAAFVAAISVTAVAFAQPPPQGGPASPRPGPGSPGSGYPMSIGRLVIPSPDAPPTRRHAIRRVWNETPADSGVVAVQRALKKRGYYAGSLDGDTGPGTRAAIRGFRAEHGLGSSTRIDGPLLRALGL